MKHYCSILFWLLSLCIIIQSPGAYAVGPPGILQISPSSADWEFSGSAGGPFTPTSQELTFQNTGGSSFDFTISTTATWFDLSTTSGTIAGGDSMSVFVTLNSEAEALTSSTQGTLSFELSEGTMGMTAYTVKIVLSSSQPGILSVEPTESFWASGDPGGPFSPDSKVYTLTNTGAASLDFSVSQANLAGDAWFDLSSTSGTLAAGASTYITLFVNSNAESLTQGTYNDTVTFTNTTNGNGDATRPATLLVNTTPPGVLSITPAESYVPSGNIGGPFSPEYKAYTLTNTGGSSFDYTVSNNESWLDATPASGTLAAGASESVTVAVNSTANSFDQGSYSDTLTFTNTTNGNGNATRPVTLQVDTKAPGVLSISPSETYIVTGEPGGPFNPLSKTYTLSNTGSASIDFAVAKIETWLDVSAASGTLEAGESTSVTLSVNAEADTFSTGNYSDNVVFTNETNGNGNATRPVTLMVNANLSSSLSVTPAEDYIAAGEVGGPFSPESTTYTLSNTGGATMDFSVACNENWLTLSPASGTIAPSSSTTVTVSINSTNATGLAEGYYYDSVTFSNETDGTGNASRTVTLSVGAGTTGILTVTPAEDYSSSGAVGGPFSPDSITYTLTNNGGADLNFAVANSQSWTTLSNTSGTLTPGGSATVTVSINSDANSLAEGTYYDAITFTNETDGTGNASRTVMLTVDNSSGFSWTMFMPAILSAGKQ